MTMHLSLLVNTDEFNYEPQSNELPYYYSYLFYDF